MPTPATSPLGATWSPPDLLELLVWAPRAARVEVVLGGPWHSPSTGTRRIEALHDLGDGYHHLELAGVAAGTTYQYRLHRPSGEVLERPDPASRWQPLGVHGPSAVDDPHVAWHDEGFLAPPLHEQILYELHVGTFTSAGTFDSVVAHLDALVDLGVTTIELLPVAQFPGDRNWGYDGTFPFAVQASYGGPAGLRRLVDAAHRRGLAVVLDVVYNHLGPEGNYLADFGPYFTDRHVTPWGPSVNVDGPDSDAVRRYLVDNAVRWVRDFHLDGLRLDAVHAIVDQSATHLLEELAAAVHAEGVRLGRRVHVVAESDLCDARLLRHPEAGGYGLDAQWADDFHHALHVALTGERDGYYADYRGLRDLAAQLRDRYVHAGRYAPSRRRTVGRPAPDVPYDRFVVCTQNHDQVGNRRDGDRLHTLVDLEAAKLAAAALLTAPFVPMLFMGQEHADPAPFQFFTSHGDPEVAAAVREGRRREFAGFDAFDDEPPDPQDTATRARSTIDLDLRSQGLHATVYALYVRLIALRRATPILSDPDAPDVEATPVPDREALLLRRRSGRHQVLVALNADTRETTLTVDDAAGRWRVLLDTAETTWGGPQPPRTTPIDAQAGLVLHVAPTSAVILDLETP